MLRSGTERGEPRNIKRVSVLNRMNVGSLDLAQFRLIFSYYLTHTDILILQETDLPHSFGGLVVIH